MTEPGSLSRRSLIASTVGLACADAPPRDWSPGHPSIHPDPDVIVVDPSFRQFAPGNSAVRRLWTGA